MGPVAGKAAEPLCVNLLFLQTVSSFFVVSFCEGDLIVNELCLSLLSPVPEEVYHYMPAPCRTPSPEPATPKPERPPTAQSTRSHRKLARLATAVKSLVSVDKQLRRKKSDLSTPPLPPRLRRCHRSQSAPSLAVNSLPCLP